MAAGRDLGGLSVSWRALAMRGAYLAAGRHPGPFYAIAPLVARVTWALYPAVRRRVVRNLLPLCDGDVARARREGRRALQHVLEYYLDLVTLPRRDMSRFEAEHLEIYHGERLDLLRSNGAVLLVSAHTGNAELAIQALTYRGRSFAALVERLEPRDWAEYMLKLRSSAGGTFLEANFAGVRACIETLREGGVVGVMGDRDIQHTGVCVQIFQRAVRLPRGPWELARRTGALVIPIFSSRKRGDQFRIDVEEPFRVAATEDADRDIREAVERFAGLLERHLRRDPGQWAVLEDFWKVHGCGEG
ncbi:MAG: hypothetical protein KatS3mg062_1540 [Tepidiforma sp.]|nr:MAG: hypothetical protein KatS3mg062_1517 [Tepidiforma sp.]GIW14101.1 MAG: hypothetical protein KatS3mg062_1540 [Tepidiforma sp.]